MTHTFMLDYACADPENSVRVVHTLTTFIFVFLMRGGRILIQLLPDHQQPASETSFKWRFAGGPIMAKHLMLDW